MALYTEVSFNVGVYDDSTKVGIQHREQLDVTALNGFNFQSGGRIKLAGSASDIAVALQSVSSGQLISLVSASDFTVKINGSSNPALALKPQANTSTGLSAPAFLVMLANGVTSLHLGNPSATEISVDVSVVGTV